jgi:hypothetical protein
MSNLVTYAYYWAWTRLCLVKKSQIMGRRVRPKISNLNMFSRIECALYIGEYLQIDTVLP